MNNNCTIRLKVNSKDLVIASKVLRKWGVSMDDYLRLAIEKLIKKRAI